MNLLPSTELEAVNDMLAGIGEAPVSSLPTSGVSEAYIAYSILHNISRTVQQRGWDFNCEKDYPLPIDEDGHVPVPANALKVDINDSCDEIIQRGDELYNKTTHSYVFTEAQKAEITFFLAFTDIPQAARTYITVRAARVFANDVLGSDTLSRLTAQDEISARAAFLEAESDTGDFTIFDNASAARALYR